MAIVVQPDRDFWESNKKPNNLEISKTKDNDVKIVKIKNKIKKKNKQDLKFAEKDDNKD